MERNTAALTDTQFDVVVIGGGAFGAAAAWDASLRGLKTALIERHDFGGGASAECFKIVHGGIRYLQHGDIPRLRASCRERSALLRIAPHLVSPLPIVIPTYGHGREGKLFLGAGMHVYDLLTLGRNSGIPDPSRRISGTRFLSRTEVVSLFPELDQRGLTGAAMFEDGQMHNPPRLVLAMIKSAVRAGAVVCNYAEARELMWDGSRVCGVRVRDQLQGGEFDVRARLVLNASGPWAEYLLQAAPQFGQWTRGPFSRDACFMVRRAPGSRYGLAMPGSSRDRDALFARSSRHLFVVPWRRQTMIGVWHRVFTHHPDTAGIQEQELESWLAEMNAAHPTLELKRDEVCYANFGLVPFGDAASTDTQLSFGKETRLIDHRRAHGVAGLVTVIGIRFTTARGDAARALDLLLQQHPKPPARAATDRLALVGGDFEDFNALRAQAMLECPNSVSEQSLESLLRNHGTECRTLFKLMQGAPAESAALDHSATLGVEVTHAVAQEMAVHLEDVVFRRTELGTGGHPGEAALQAAAGRMQRLLGWSETRCREELSATELNLRRHYASRTAAATPV